FLYLYHPRPHLHLFSLCFSLRPPPTLTLFPYTTLFRSGGSRGMHSFAPTRPTSSPVTSRRLFASAAMERRFPHRQPESAASRLRSEEHTSELQSPDHLVCRLLLEKKKYKQKSRSHQMED